MAVDASVKYYLFSVIYFTFCVLEFAAGFMKASEALVADAYLNFYSASIWAIQAFTETAKKRQSSGRNTYGWARFEGFGALFMAIFASALYFSVTMNSLQKLFASDSYKLDKLHEIFLLSFGSVGFIIDFVTYIVLGIKLRSKYETNDMKKQGCIRFQNEFDKVVSSVVSSLLLLLNALINLLIDGIMRIYIIDAIIALIIVTMQCFPIWSVAKQSMKTLLQCVPQKIDVENIEKEIRKQFTDIVDVHELHIWELCTDEIILTAHLIILEKCKVKQCSTQVELFLKKFGVTRTTLQFEVKANAADNNSNCLIKCPGKDCEEKLCCIQQHVDTKKENA